MKVTVFLPLLLLLIALVPIYSFLHPRALNRKILSQSLLSKSSNVCEDDDSERLDGTWEIIRLGVEEIYQNGKSLAFGIFQTDVDECLVPPEAVQESLRKKASEQLVNIDENERERRRFVGLMSLLVTVAGYSALNIEHGSLLAKAVCLYIGISFSLAYLRSAELGLCNIAQDGKWDVDGTGLQKIPDRTLAQQILKRVNSMNIQIGLQSVIITGVLLVAPIITQKLLVVGSTLNM
jgi:hypothetical protein